MAVDQHLPELILLPPNTDLHNNSLYLKGHIILQVFFITKRQDKASCFPAAVLNPPKGSHVIDACAAPGNKTSHVAAKLNNTGRIWAWEKDHKRSRTLKEMTTKAGCTSNYN